MDDVTASAAIAAAAALLSSGLTGTISLRLAARAERHRDRGDLAASLAAFGFAVDKLALELDNLPRPAGAATQQVNWLVRRLPTLDWWLGQVTRYTLASPGLRAYEGLMAATNRLLLVAPEAIVMCVRRIHALLEDPRPHEDEWKDDWARARADLLRESRLAARR